MYLIFIYFYQIKLPLPNIFFGSIYYFIFLNISTAVVPTYLSINYFLNLPTPMYKN